MDKKVKLLTSFVFFSCLVFFNSLFAQDEDEDVQEVVVTGSRITAGGAQDINFFRAQLEEARIPHPETITAEGLLSQHDILLKASENCEQLFCLTTESLKADLIARPDAELLVGVGFSSNIDSESWTREPLNLIAVVDKSGSMSGKPLGLVRKSLEAIINAMNDNDQLSIVLYGDRSHVYLEPVLVGNTNKDELIQLVRNIESNGSTFMEEGLKVGYRLANTSAEDFEGTTRVMLFTDERPNVGKTDADSFIGMAIEASGAGVGLTTIGVGTQFGAKLATTISSVRGGNLFFVEDETGVTDLFETDFNYMVSEVAHDLELLLSVTPNYKISGVYGVPGEIMTWKEEQNISIEIPTVFLSSKGGGIFFTLTRDIKETNLPQRTVTDNNAVASINLSYKSATDGKTGSDSYEVMGESSNPSEGMVLGHYLIDEYLVLFHATTEHHVNNDQEAAWQLIHALNSRLQSSDLESLESEKELITSFHERIAQLSGHGSELPDP